MKIAVWCASEIGADPAFAEAAQALGTAIAARGHGLVYGGSCGGLMGTVADACLAGGAEAVEKLFVSGFPEVLLILLGAVLAVVLIVLALQGKELADYVIDNRGIHEIHYLPAPTPLKLAARLKPLSLLKEAEQGGAVPVLKLGEKNLAWKDVARVQLWPEKCMILYYAPSWWLRIAAVCTPFSWEDAMGMTREKLGKKRKIQLPPSLVIPAEPKARRSRPAAKQAPEVEEALEQLRMEELADFPPEEPGGETE